MSTDFGLPGRVAIVTGAARGLGAATAQLFARFGAHVVACDIDGEALEKSAAGFEGEGHLALAFDLSVPENCESLVARTLERHNRLDILVNVAGIIERLQLDEVDEAAWTRTMDANVKNQFFLCRAAAEPMKAAGWGRIVNFTSQAAHSGGFYGTSVYAVSKGGVVSLTKNFARLLGPHNITVNAIAPALVDTRMISEGMSADEIASVTGAMPMGRMAEAGEIAMAVAFLASDSAATITGHTLDINGGLLMR
ncbi:MAG: SDR family NAD(P)-dependent oxidoreductase [Alphaproteobacteria bacterium]|nr:SDR family NAD(P)-dependent oxidoreductase [Alphaproteobacteria bacterium]MDP6588746.1 SDR family NAD(P)-dependent oxidoreductase [Alphaproteobacteria bacterium]MDP6819298.1 SDR family NAD(P)-dependent oxidoreductase [Alphaproteobacteria bacterium]